MSSDVSIAIEKQVEDELAKFRGRAKIAMDGAVTELQKKGDEAYGKITEDAKQVEEKVKWVLLGIGALVFAGVLAAVVESDREVNKSVIDLQRDIIAAQTTVRDSEKSITDAKKALTDQEGQASKEVLHLKQTAAELDNARQELKNITDQLDRARADYRAMREPSRK